MAYTTLNQGFLIDANVIGSNNSTSYDISRMIEDIMIKKSYLSQNMPLFVIDLKITEEIRDFIRDNETLINLTIYTYNITDTSDADDEDDNEPTITDTYYSGVIRLYDVPYTTTSAKSEDDSDTDEDKTQAQSVPMVYYRVSGIPLDIIQKNSRIINQVYSDCSFNDILVNLVSNIESNDIYIQPTDNQDIKTSVLIPPLTLIQSIQYLNNAYQLYDGLCNIFLDTDCTYVYNPLSSDLKKSNIFDYKVMSINSTGNSTEYIRPSIDWENQNIRLVVNRLTGFSEEQKIVGNSLGSDITYYSYDDNFNLISRGTSSNLGYEKTKYFWNPNKRSIFENANTNQVESLSSALMIALKNISPAYIKPTTDFVLDSSGYNSAADGHYYLSQMTVSFSSTDSKHFTSVIGLSLYKKR